MDQKHTDAPIYLKHFICSKF